MSKTLFLLQYRGGSTYFQSLQTTKKYNNDVRKEQLVRVGFSNLIEFLPSQVEGGYAVEVDGSVRSELITRMSNVDNISHRRWYGDWWGQGCNVDTIPEPYVGDSSMAFSPKVCQLLFNEGWKIIAIVRHPQNLVPSIYNFHGPLETRNRNERGREYFIYLCKAVRNKYRMISDCMRAFPDNYLVVKFEDLLKDPVIAMRTVYSFMRIPLDEEIIRENANRIDTDRVGRIERGISLPHSSFKDQNFNQRIKSVPAPWVKAGYPFFYQEMISLGYNEL